MSNVLRFSILLFGVLSAVLCHNVRDDVPWFKERERITDRFLVGMINGRNTRCNGTWNGGQVEGICLPARECTNLGGVKGSACSFLGTCCILEKTCGGVTNSKLSYFVPPKVFQPDCSLTIKPINRDVCQIRLDFEKFSIAKPTQPDDLEFGSRKSFQCYHDAFTVTGGGGGYLGFEHLCGENTKQHIYVPVSNQNNIVLRFQLNPNRNNVSFLGSLPDWRIRIRQLECSRSHQHDSIHSSLTAMHHHHHHHHNKTGYSDHYLIAPAGCLQYYPERTGYYESFNFMSGQGPYIGKTNYAICFRRTPDVCGIRHTAQFFVMSYNVKEVEGRLEVECHRSGPADPTTSQDSLQIPGGVYNNQRMEYYCDEHLTNLTSVTSSKPGPLYVVVRTDGFRPFDRVEIGFRMQYQLQNTGCELPV